MDTGFQSNLDARIAFKQMTGLTIRLTPWEILRAIKEQDADTVVVTIKTFTVEERRTEVVLTAGFIRLIGFRRTDSGWVEFSRLTVADPEFTESVHIPTFGPGKSVAEWYEARQRERMAYRVGSTRNPLDNYSRVGAGYTPDRMARHWK